MYGSKVLWEAACLQLAERLFQSFTSLNEKDFLPFSVPFLVLHCVVYCPWVNADLWAFMILGHLLSLGNKTISNKGEIYQSMNSFFCSIGRLSK